MIIPLQKIKAHEPYTFHGRVDVSELEEMNNDIRQISEVDVDGKATLDGKVYRFDLNLKGKMILPCARTLVDVDYPFSFDVEENFTKVDYEASEEDEIFLVDREVLDLEPYIKENILLGVPLRVYSDEEQLSKAEDEGDGWEMKTEDAHIEEQLNVPNEEDENEEDKPVDPRLASLKKFFDKDNNDE